MPPAFPWLQPLTESLRRHLESGPPRDGAHDLGHVLRVARLAGDIAVEEGADPDICLAGALLHDLVYFPKNHPDSSRSAALSAALVPEWCAPFPDLAARAAAIVHCVEAHSFSGGIEPRTLEAKVVQDADRLEALGAIGIARAFATGGHFGGGLWHPEDPWGEHRELDDKAWSLDHFPKKLLRLREAMHTASGRRRAEAREALVHRFLQDLRAELGG
ncbi:MAG: HD domain-containing protein [Acidobacteria bacterium]|nr:HD domain-containing protein [Acidobacteriota bacterium]